MPLSCTHKPEVAAEEQSRVEYSERLIEVFEGFHMHIVKPLPFACLDRPW